MVLSSVVRLGLGLGLELGLELVCLLFAVDLIVFSSWGSCQCLTYTFTQIEVYALILSGCSHDITSGCYDTTCTC